MRPRPDTWLMWGMTSFVPLISVCREPPTKNCLMSLGSRGGSSSPGTGILVVLCF